MLYETRKHEKRLLRANFLPILFLNLALTSFIPHAKAQSAEAAEPTGTISGTVLSQGDNRTLSQIAVGLKSHEAGVFHSMLTDYDGHFEVAGLPLGSYEINVEETGYDTVRTKAQLEGPSLKLVLYMTPVKWTAASTSDPQATKAAKPSKSHDRSWRDKQWTVFATCPSVR
jgi:hypothetical protein